MPRSFSYVDSYNGDIRFDNIYISTYFCQIDERRKKLVSGHSPDPGCPAVCTLWPRAPGGRRALVSVTVCTLCPGQADFAAAPQSRGENRHLPLQSLHAGLGDEKRGEGAVGRPVGLTAGTGRVGRRAGAPGRAPGLPLLSSGR